MRRRILNVDGTPVLSTPRTSAWAALLMILSSGCPELTAPPQPIAFNHKLHLSIELEGQLLRCTDCHIGAERQEHASFPPIKECLRCHMRPQMGDRAEPTDEEQLVRAFGAKGGEFRWIQVTRNPGHVIAPHRAHVGLGKMECETCHGDVHEWTEPPRVPNADLLSMSKCLDCHRERGAPTECAACHR
ncbi:MAG: cytochrome c3 family protein [Deltaproteobacteria bacterium]|nr:cytochrome c3 family protein [Deltaproteobacteria bacterium]